MKKLIMLLFLIFSISGCDRIKVENLINAKEIEIRDLKERNLLLINEVKDLTAQVARLNASHPNGAMVEELRKSLTRKESELQQREERIVRAEESLRLMEERVARLQQGFYTDTSLKMEEIGEARQIRKDYAIMQDNVKTVNERANNWLIYISVLGIGFFASIVFLIFTSIQYQNQRRDIDSALKYVDAVELEESDKRLIASYLGKRLKHD